MARFSAQLLGQNKFVHLEDVIINSIPHTAGIHVARQIQLQKRARWAFSLLFIKDINMHPGFSPPATGSGVFSQREHSWKPMTY